MNRKLIVVATLSLVFSLTGMAQPVPQAPVQPAQLSHRELHSLMQNAHDSSQYMQLAGYFRQQEAQYRAQAAAELVERNRRAQNTMGSAQKYPRPVDSAQYLYESYLFEADHAAAHAQYYERLAAAVQGKS